LSELNTETQPAALPPINHSEGLWEVQYEIFECDYACSHAPYPYQLTSSVATAEHYGRTQPVEIANFVEAQDCRKEDAELIAHSPELLKFVRKCAETGNEEARNLIIKIAKAISGEQPEYDEETLKRMAADLDREVLEKTQMSVLPD
jgi:hypothetical protein